MADSEQQSAPLSAPPAETVGQALQKARAAQELSLEQLAAELRIEPQQLLALEQNKFERIGVPVFVKGYLKQYGARLGLDPRDLLALYYKQGNLKEVDIRPSQTIKLRDERQVTGWLIGGLVLAVIAVVFGVWWFSDTGFGPVSAPAAAPNATPSAPAPEGAAGASVAPVAAPPALAPPEAAPVTPPPPATGALATVAPTTVAASVLGATAPVSAPVTASAASAAPAGAAANVSANATDLELTFNEESWTEVTDARGERLLFGMSSAGRHAKLRGEAPIAVVLGNADAVKLLVDGATFPIPADGRQGKLARFTVDVSVTED